MRMHVRRMLIGVLGAALAGGALSAQAPVSELDAHITAAKAAAGLDYRATFVNLCFPGANPGLANPAAALRQCAAHPAPECPQLPTSPRHDFLSSENTPPRPIFMVAAVGTDLALPHGCTRGWRRLLDERAWRV